MAYSSIVKPTEYFNTIIYTGDGTSNRNITGFGFQPDWLWQKTTNQTFNHYLFDSVRGNSSVIKSNSTDAEDTSTTGFNGFISDGFNVSQVTGWEMNNSSLSVEYANWCWRGAGSTASNGDGSITSTVSANTTAGFSIVSYTGTGSSTTVGHGLGVAPSMLIFKNRDSTDSWNVQHDGLTSYDYYVRLNSTGAQNNDIDVGNSAPTSTVVSVGSHAQQNGSGNDMILYAFAEKKGYSKIGSYTGNGNADGPLVYTGFKPAWVMTKRTDSTSGWIIRDNKRDTFNPSETSLYPNANTANDTSGGASYYLDFLSNGFKFRGSGTAFNASGGTYIYLAFAENPFVANDSGTAVPVVAR